MDRILVSLLLLVNLSGLSRVIICCLPLLQFLPKGNAQVCCDDAKLKNPQGKGDLKTYEINTYPVRSHQLHVLVM